MGWDVGSSFIMRPALIMHDAISARLRLRVVSGGAGTCSKRSFKKKNVFDMTTRNGPEMRRVRICPHPVRR